MKKLIDVAAVKAMKEQGKYIVYVDGNTLLTPAARDEIILNSMTIQEDYGPVRETTFSASCYQEKNEKAVESPKEEVNAEMILKVLAHLRENGLLQSVLESCKVECKPYKAEYDAAGFKLIRGDSIQTQVLATGDSVQTGKIRYREIVGADDGSLMAAGMITIDNTDFNWETECQGICHIVSGCITVTIDGKVYEAEPGDAFFIKKGVKCTLGAKGLGKAFYATHKS